MSLSLLLENKCFFNITTWFITNILNTKPILPPNLACAAIQHIRYWRTFPQSNNPAILLFE